MGKANTEIDFWNKVDRRGPDECWPYVGYREVRGYGRIVLKGKVMLAHRQAFLFANGHLPPAVCHHCDNPPCCNPKHLFGGDRAANNKDRARKQRSAPTSGERNPFSVLTDSLVVAIRKEYAETRVTQSELSRKYNVSNTTVGQVIRGQRWAHLPVPPRRSLYKKKSRVCDKVVLAIRKRYCAGEPQSELAKDFSLSQTIISNIVKGKFFRHLPIDGGE